MTDHTQDQTAHSLKIDFTEFRRGWHVLLIAIIGVITSGGVMPLYTFGPLVEPLQQTFGWSRGVTQTTITFFFVGLLLGAPTASLLISRFGLRRAAMISAIALAACYAALTQITASKWTLYIGYLVMTVLSAGTHMVMWTQLVNLWFFRNRGLALAITLSGTGLCTLLLAPLVARVVEAWSWQIALLMLGGISLLVTLPLIYWFMPNAGPQEHAETARATANPVGGMSYREALRSRYLPLIVTGLTLVVIGILGMLTNTVPLLRDNGLSAITAASIFGTYGISLVIGRTVSGYLIDRFWAPGIAFVTLSLPALGCLLFGIEHSNTTVLVIAAMLVGIGAGAEYDIASFLIGRYFGLRNYNQIFSTFSGIVALFTCIAPFIFGYLYDLTGSYNTMLWICGFNFVVGPLLLLMLGAYPNYDSNYDTPAS